MIHRKFRKTMILVSEDQIMKRAVLSVEDISEESFISIPNLSILYLSSSNLFKPFWYLS